MELRRTTEAYRALHDVLRLAPTHGLAREELANLCRDTGREEEEISQRAALAEAEPDNLEPTLALGRAQARAGHTEDAINVLGRAATRFGHPPLVYRVIAQIWLERAIADNDSVALNKGLEATRRATQGGLPADSTLMTLTGNAWLRARQPRRALRSYEQATLSLPVDPAAYPRLADTAEQLGHWSAARDALRHAHALALDGSASAARLRMLRLGDLSMKIGDPEEAATWYARARQGANDTTAALRLAAAEQAISKERPLFPEAETPASPPSRRR